MQFTINHHMGGVALASVCVKRATNPELLARCAEARATQLREIEVLRGWLRDWYGINYGGIVLPEAVASVQRLSALSGAPSKTRSPMCSTWITCRSSRSP